MGIQEGMGQRSSDRNMSHRGSRAGPLRGHLSTNHTAWLGVWELGGRSRRQREETVLSCSFALKRSSKKTKKRVNQQHI